MRKKICSLVLAVALTFQAASFRTERAHAVMGIMNANPWFIGMGVAFTSLGIAGVSLGAWGASRWHRRSINDTNGFSIVIPLAGIFAVAGIVMLDEESGAPSFTALSGDVIAGAQLTEDESASYHLELPELNRALNASATDLVAQGYTTAEEAMAHPEFWQARAANLMPETRSALTKLGAYAQSRMAAAQ